MDTPEPQSSSPAKAPSLLPAFEPLSSPGGLPPRRHGKRKYDEHVRGDRSYYPTPVPTSSTGVLPSSPYREPTRPGLQRSVSALAERAPLGAVPKLEVPVNGDPVLLGRSSNSSDYQLSANRLISRVHVRATYTCPTDDCAEEKIRVECLGWNGCKIHLSGEVVELAKGDAYESTKPESQILVDVQDTRVLLLWPPRSVEAFPTASSRAGSESPSKRRALDTEVLPSSPPSLCPRIRSPLSLPVEDHVNPSFAATFIASQSSVVDDDAVKVYEDSGLPDDFQRDATPTPARTGITPSVDGTSASLEKSLSTQSSVLSEPEELSEHDEENEPLVHSFGPYGANILAKFASFKSVASPGRLDAEWSSDALEVQAADEDQPSSRKFRESPIKNHVINQLAFSRVHSIPLSTILSNVPAEMKMPKSAPAEVVDTLATIKGMTQPELKAVLTGVPCIGQINREGKDAAGKALEDEFYYLPDLDEDEMRRNTVSVGRPPLRNVRKQHKVCSDTILSASRWTDECQQYYWKKPR